MNAPILRGHARRLGLRKPTGVYRYRDGTTVYFDEMPLNRYGITVDEAAEEDAVRRFAESIGYTLEGWQQIVWGKRLSS